MLVVYTKCAFMCLVTWIMGHYITCHASLSVSPNDLNHKRTLMHAPNTTTA